LENQKFIKVIKNNNNNSELYININNITTFYAGGESNSTIVNLKHNKRLSINEHVDVFADRISM